MSSKAGWSAAAAALLLTWPACAAGGQVAAVLSSEGGAYLEAFSAFQAEYGSEVPHFDFSRGKAPIPPGTGTVVTFGIRAMAQQYPRDVNIVSCLAPGYFLTQEGRTGSTVRISMLPAFQRVLATIKRIQPQVKRLRVFWMAENYGVFREQFLSAGAEAGVNITTAKASGIDELPALLRDARNEIDAFFLPPDPLLISPESLMIFREFSWSNGIPMYASTKGITKEGASASIGISFAESGASAARVVKGLHAGVPQPAVFFPEKVEITLNSTAARKCGLQFPPDLVRDAAYLFP